MTPAPQPEIVIPLPDPDLIRAAISRLDGEAALYRRLLSAVICIEGYQAVTGRPLLGQPGREVSRAD